LIKANKIGGYIIIDVTNLKEDDEIIINEIAKRLSDRAKCPIDLIIKRRNNLLKVFSYRKKV